MHALGEYWCHLIGCTKPCEVRGGRFCSSDHYQEALCRLPGCRYFRPLRADCRQLHPFCCVEHATVGGRHSEAKQQSYQHSQGEQFNTTSSYHGRRKGQGYQQIHQGHLHEKQPNQPREYQTDPSCHLGSGRKEESYQRLNHDESHFEEKKSTPSQPGVNRFEGKQSDDKQPTDFETVVKPQSESQFGQTRSNPRSSNKKGEKLTVASCTQRLLDYYTAL